MTHDSIKHQVQRFIHGLDEEQLESLQYMLFSFGDADSGVQIASYYQGITAQIMHFKFGHCECGQKHEQVEDFLRNEAASAGNLVEMGMTVDPPVAAPDGQEYSPADLEADLQAEREDRIELLRTYNMREGDVAPVVICNGCNTSYVSLMDRMLKQPDDCHHCHLKAKNG